MRIHQAAISHDLNIHYERLNFLNHTFAQNFTFLQGALKRIMKKIGDYRRLLGVTESAELKELKTIYRNLMKDWHPDKFHDNPDGLREAEEKSKHIIEAYHFLVSIAPETRALSLAEYTQTIAANFIADFEYKSQVLIITFADGNKYEYFGVPKAIYVKLVNADAPARFARRHICSSYVYRNVTKSEVPA